MKTYEFKLYASDKNKYLDHLLEIGCEVYNFALDLKKNLYKDEKISIKINDLQKILADMRNSDGYKHWQDLGSQVVQQITERIYNGYTLFFKALKNKEKGKRRINPPKAKKLYKYKSITFKQAGFKLFQDNKIRIGEKEFKYHKSREVHGKIKTLTVKRNSIGEYFIYIVTDYTDPSLVLARSGKSVGFDFGLKTYLTGSDNYDVTSPLFFKKNKKIISKLSKKLKSKAKTSNNRIKARLNLARRHIDIANRRKDFHWKLALDLVRRYDTIYLEDLNIYEMSAKYGKKISDLGFSDFVKILEYVAEKRGKQVVKISRWFPSSKKCSICGEVNQELLLWDRKWECKCCKTRHDRDRNAAYNILAEGSRKIAVGASTVHKVMAFIRSCISKIGSQL